MNASPVTRSLSKKSSIREKQNSASQELETRMKSRGQDKAEFRIKQKQFFVLIPSDFWLLDSDSCFSSLQFVKQSARGFVLRVKRERAVEFSLRASDQADLDVKLRKHDVV